MPQRKKDPSTRARRNKASTAATLQRPSDREQADYSALTMAQLKDEIDRRNDGRVESAKLSKRGTKASLVKVLIEDDVDVPPLPPERDWHSMTQEWWADIWASPMSPEWDDSDIHNLFILAAIYNDIWVAETAKQRKESAVEFRLQRADLGLSPYSRRRLEWTIESAAEAKDRGEQRRSRQSAPAAQTASKSKAEDPRAALALVK